MSCRNRKPGIAHHYQQSAIRGKCKNCEFLIKPRRSEDTNSDDNDDNDDNSDDNGVYDDNDKISQTGSQVPI